MDQRIIDLHVHSTESDGTLTPVELIAAAKEAGLSAIAITDHDTCSGIKKATEAAANAGIELVPGIELSTAYTFPNGTEKEIHVVGLYIDPDNPELLQQTAGIPVIFATNAMKKWLLPCKKKVFRSPWKPCSPKIRTV